MLYALILAGGKGERFWPLSRQVEPKQFLKVTGKMSLIQQTISRIKKLIPLKNIFIITNYQYKDEINRQLGIFNFSSDNIILEPEGKNTALAIGIFAKKLYLIDKEAIMVILPADHFILNETRFLKTIQAAEDLARGNYLVCLGIKPISPRTGYGYIKIKSRLVKNNAFIVKNFIEKPSLMKVKSFFKDRRFFWNSGIFIWKAKLILEELKRYAPLIYIRLKNFTGQSSETETLRKIYKGSPSISIDYAVMEQSKRIAVMPAVDLGWSDVGSWDALDEVLPKDSRGNIIQADSLDIKSKNLTILGRERLIATIGLEDLIIIDSDDALLVCRKEMAQEVRNIVNMLKDKNRAEYLLHKTVKRPWGSYTVLETGKGFKVKLVELDPHKRLSLQYHKNRAEHWIVLEGSAKITKNRRSMILNSNESTFITKSTVHRLENPLNTPLKIVEVQSGNYLEEDDIVRIKDDFKRCQ